MMSIRVYCAESEAKSAGSAVHRNVPRQYIAAPVPPLKLSLLRDVYTVAQSVLVWLGPHSDESAELSDFFYLDVAAGARWQAEEKRTSVPANLTKLRGRMNSNDQLSQALQNLVCYPYWRRTWVIQEIVLVKNIRIFCGDSSLPWADFAPIVQRLYKVPSKNSQSSPFERVCEL
jgi:hypothetical protein